MKNLPMSDSAKRSAHEKIQEAYFNLGKVYMNNLNNPPKAIDAFKNLISKYPDNPFKLSAYYYLYKMYNEQGSASEANTYKNRITSEFPESNHAKVLTNPDYFKELENKKNQAEKLYSETLESYQNKEFQKVLANCSKAKEEIKDSTYLSRFEYLRAISIGQTRDIISFRQSLQSVAENYPDSEVAGQAQDILAYLKKTELQQISKKFAQNRSLLNHQDTTSGEEASKTASQNQQQEKDSLYQFNKEEPYYFVVIANPEKIDIGRLKFDLINFNLDYFLQKDYATSSEEFNEYYNIVTVKRFKNRDVAEKYYDILSKKEDRVFSEINSDEYRYFYISVKNYLTLLDKKSIIEYINFFKKNELLAADNSQQ
jgi:hypothetical protein